MDASQIVDTLHDAGLSIALTPEQGLKVTPASGLTPELRDLIRASKDLLIDWLDAANDLQPFDREAWPERAAIAEYDGGLSRQDAEALADASCWPHGTAMNGPEIDTFTARLARFADKGLILADAERLADKLVHRDRDGDDRRVCLECVHLRHGGRCSNWRAAGVATNAMDARLPGDFTTILQRCDGFTEVTR